MNQLPQKITSGLRMEIAEGTEHAGQGGDESDQIHLPRRTAVMSEDVSASSSILFIDEVAAFLRVSRSTIERRRRDGTFPIGELPSLDSRPRWSRQVVERFLSSATRGLQRARRVSRR